MIDLIKAENEFKKYAQTYDMSLDGISRKYVHSFRVMKISKEIAKSLNLNNEETELATLIGLLHDIARFEEFVRYNNYDVKYKFDHGDYAVKILEENNFIRKFIETDKYDKLIFTAIKNHNKFKLEDNLDKYTLLQCKIIRDADKVDIFYEATKMFWNTDDEINKIENSKILDSYYNNFLDKKLILRVPEQQTIDELVACMAFIFDLNFKYSFQKTKSEDYINKTLDRFKYKEPETIERIKHIKDVANEFINQNI